MRVCAKLKAESQVFLIINRLCMHPQVKSGCYKKVSPIKHSPGIPAVDHPGPVEHDEDQKSCGAAGYLVAGLRLSLSVVLSHC